MTFFEWLFSDGEHEAPVEHDYREQRTGDRYRMKYVRRGKDWAPYALTFPPDPHKKGVHTNHKHADGRICIAHGVNVPTLSKAKAIAIHWMTGWSMYVRSAEGTWPRNGHVRVNVPD